MNEMINTSTSIFPLLTISSSNSFYYNISIFTFSVVASINHVLPENLNRLTHVVKMLFSNILFSLINVNPIVGIALSIVDLSPLLTNNSKMKQMGESLLQMPRLMIEIFLMYKIHSTNFYDVIIMLLCKIIYYFERKARIKKGIRNDFSSWHAVEHLGLYLLFKDTTEVEFCLTTLCIFFLTFIFINASFLHFTNVYLHVNMMDRAPHWVKQNEELTTILNEKLIKNKTSLKYRNYIIKPWASHLKLEFVSWKAIELICESIITQINPTDFDMVIGISTGGCFVGKYIAIKMNLPYGTVRSKFWSNISFLQNYTQAYKYALGYHQIPNHGEIPDVTGKRILLVDDTTYTGITLNGIKKALIEKGMAANVSTAVMWTKGSHNPDYFYTNKRIPIIWEWGAEVD